jgi:hypothetical protein
LPSADVTVHHIEDPFYKYSFAYYLIANLTRRIATLPAALFEVILFVIVVGE